jgi:hypothetical protein
MLLVLLVAAGSDIVIPLEGSGGVLRLSAAVGVLDTLEVPAAAAVDMKVGCSPGFGGLC